MISDFYKYFNSENDLELEGYCEYITASDDFTVPPTKIYIFYINALKGKFEFIFSNELEIFEVRDISQYEPPEKIIEEYCVPDTIKNVKYYAVNEGDYLNRKLLEMVEDNNKIFFFMYDFVITIDKTKRAGNIDFFIKSIRYVKPVPEEKFINSVVYSKRTIAKPGSLEEKLYHYEDVTEQERELFYKNKKTGGGGFTAAQKSR